MFLPYLWGIETAQIPAAGDPGVAGFYPTYEALRYVEIGAKNYILSIS